MMKNTQQEPLNGFRPPRRSPNNPDIVDHLLMGTIIDALREEGKAEGLAVGRADTLPMRLLWCLGSLLADGNKRLDTASLAELDVIFDADPLDAVLRSYQP